MKHRKTWSRRAAALVIGTLLLTGCKGGIPIVSEMKETKAYTLPETMIVVATERNRYEQMYTGQIWDAALDEEGTTFEQYLLGQVRGFLEELRIMNEMAKERDVTLDGSEKEKVRLMSEEYFNSLSEGDLAFIQADQDDVYALYEDYAIANKAVGELTKDMDMEISDSEAKVITIQQIEVWNEDTANTVAEKAAEEGVDFLELAKEYSVNPETEIQVGRGEADQALEDVIFQMEEGQVSDIIQVNSGYFIVKCVNDYNQEATAKRKEQLMKEKKARAFQLIYQQYTAENPMTFSDDVWNEVTLDGGESCTTTDFFQLYQKYFTES
ncbi:MAG: peptidylprolyl isomerase [Lachnospiraceae bacterium]